MKFGMLVELLFLIPNILIFFKIGQIEPKLQVFTDGYFLCSLKQKIYEKLGGLTS